MDEPPSSTKTSRPETRASGLNRRPAALQADVVESSNSGYTYSSPTGGHVSVSARSVFAASPTTQPGRDASSLGSHPIDTRKCI